MALRAQQRVVFAAITATGRMPYTFGPRAAPRSRASQSEGLAAMRSGKVRALASPSSTAPSNTGRACVYL
eukprot:366024-Chlamydomonas_euryale.AAC.27